MKDNFETIQILGLDNDCEEMQYFTKYDVIGPARNLILRLATPHLCYVEIREFHLIDCEDDNPEINEWFDDLYSYHNQEAFEKLWELAKEVN